MAIGRVWYGAKYSHRVWERFAHICGNLYFSIKLPEHVLHQSDHEQSACAVQSAEDARQKATEALAARGLSTLRRFHPSRKLCIAPRLSSNINLQPYCHRKIEK